MQTKSFILFFVVLSYLFLFSCQKYSMSSTKSLLIGKDWVEANVGDETITVLRFNKDETFVIITLKKCGDDDFCSSRIFNYNEIEYYINEIIYGQKWVLETDTKLKLFYDKDNYESLEISNITNDVLKFLYNYYDSYESYYFEVEYVNYGNEIAKLARLKSKQE